jgi:outer membrane protein
MEIKLMVKILWFLSLFLLIPTLIFSQSTQKSINLEKAIEIALERNITVSQFKNSYEFQKSGYKSAVGAFLPTLSANGSFNREQSWQPATSATQKYVNGTLVDIPASAGYSASNQYSASVRSNLTLFDGFANIANLNRSEAETQAAELNLKRTQQSIIYQTHQRYLILYKNFQLLKVNEENLKRSRQQLQRIEETNKVGAAALADVYRQRVNTANDELGLINAQNDYDKSKNDMELFLSLDRSEKYEYDFSSLPSDIDTSEFNSLNQKYQNIEELYKKAIEQRDDYLSAVQNLNISNSSLTVARSGVYPSVSASASYGIGDQEFSKMNNNKSLSLGVGVSLPIFSGFQTQMSIEQAKITKRNAEDQLKQTERQVLVDIEQARLDLESAEKQLKVTQESVVSAEMDRKIAEEKYNLGAGTLLDLYIASLNYVTAQSNKVNSVASFLLAKKQMEFVLGTISN